jgi:colanic acid/amylovoran biosynthesis glycosyltransferase
MKVKRLKTLHIFESYLPESQNWAFRILENFKDTDVYVCTFEYHNPHFITPNINVIPIPDYVSSKLMVEGGDLHDSIYNKAINKLKRKTRFEKYLEFVAAKAKDLEIDLIHCHFANVGWKFMRLKKMTKLPLVISFYGFDYESLPYTFKEWEKRYQELFNVADLFICEGTFGAEILRLKGCPEQKIKVNHLGVDLKRFSFYKREKKENQLRLVQISNFFQKKGQIYSLQAFIQASKTCPNLSLTFVGYDIENNKAKLKKIADENNVQDKVVFLDFLDFSLLHEFLKSYDVFIQPSCYAENRDCEGGAPVAILDAEATGMPVISTTHCDIPNEVIHNKTGYLTQEKNVNALTESIVRFYRMTNETYTEFSKNARKHIEENFDAVKNSASLRNIYVEHLNKLALATIAIATL